MARAVDVPLTIDDFQAGRMGTIPAVDLGTMS